MLYDNPCVHATALCVAEPDDSLFVQGALGHHAHAGGGGLRQQQQLLCVVLSGTFTWS